MKSTRALSLAILLSTGVHPSHGWSAETKVFAASSLTDALKEIAADYQRESGDRITFNFGASSLLARQIGEGAPADIFFSADEAKMDELQTNGLILKESRTSRLSNVLVIVVAAQNGARINSPEALTNAAVKRIAVGDAKSVPIGIYAREYLEKLRLWDAVRPKLVIVDNVRAGLSTVEAGNADCAFVYKTDAAISRKVKVAVEVPSDQGAKIRYSMARVTGNKGGAAAENFFHYLGGEKSAKVFRKFGFIVLE